MIDPLIAIRTIHFASAILVAGAATFSLLVADPIWHRGEPAATHFTVEAGLHTTRLIWGGLIVVVISGAAWLMTLAASIEDTTWAEAISDGTAWTLLTETQFGLVWMSRLAGAAVLAVLLTLPQLIPKTGATGWRRIAIAATAAFLLGSLAGVGHAATTTGATGLLHFAADILHLLASGAWVGGLVPLVLVVGRARGGPALLAETSQALCRFSTLGLASVSVLVVTGLINTWFLTNGLRGLFGTEYGGLLQLKILLFLAMMGPAALNRYRLVPRLAQAVDAIATEPANTALKPLRASVAIEIALAFAVIALAAILGLTPPAGHHH